MKTVNQLPKFYVTKFNDMNSTALQNKIYLTINYD